MERLEICRPAEIKEVQIQDTFWSQYMELVRDTVIPYQWEILNDRVPDVERSHAVRNFKIAAGVEKGCFMERCSKTATWQNGWRLRHTVWRALRSLSWKPSWMR